MSAAWLLNYMVFLDSTIVRAHQHSSDTAKKRAPSDRAIGRSRGRLTSKIFALLEGLDNLDN